MAAGAPFDGVTRILHAATTAHHRIEVEHQKGDVVECIVVGIAKRQAVVIAVAPHEGHDTGPIRQTEIKHLLQKLARGLHMAAVEHHMRQPYRPIRQLAHILVQFIPPDQAKYPAICIRDGHRLASPRFLYLRDCLKNLPPMPAHQMGHLVQGSPAARAQGHMADACWSQRMMQCQQMVICAGAAQVNGIWRASGHLQMPDFGIELFCLQEVGHGQGDTSQGTDAR